MIYDIIIDLLKHLLDTLDFLKPYATTVGVVFIILRQNNIRKVINGHLPKHFRDNRDYDIQEIKSDLKDIKNYLGIGVVPSNTQLNGQETIPILSYKRFFLFLQAVTKRPNQRRKQIMQFLKSNISKKLFTILIGVAVTALNKKLDLQLSANDIYIMFIGIITYIAGQSHVDAKRALANTVKAISVGVQAAVPNIEPMPDITYAELVPTIKNVHDGINNLLKDARLNDGSQTFKDASQAYFAIIDIIQTFKQPEPLPTIPDEQVSA